MADILAAYGAGKAGLPFNPVTFIQKPQVILRLVSLLFSIIVFGCISSKGYYKGEFGEEDICAYDRDSNACGFGIGIGVIAFLAAIAFLVLDAFFDNLSSVQHRKYAVMADLGFSGFWTFLWFVGFCYLTNAWSKTDEIPEEANWDGDSNVEAAIAFCFFSIASWAGLAALAFLRYRQGVAAQFSPAYEPDMSQTQYPGAGAYAAGAAPGDLGDSYQHAPFTTTNPQAMGGGGGMGAHGMAGGMGGGMAGGMGGGGGMGAYQQPTY